MPFVGRVGVPHTGDINIGDYWMVNLAMAGGPASCTTYDKEVLLKAVLDGQIQSWESVHSILHIGRY
ncbi:Alcohol dehydrogenase [Streptococcus anginosus]|nr:Alcohol dehydrogenase [Streptococcus anginosus]